MGLEVSHADDKCWGAIGVESEVSGYLSFLFPRHGVVSGRSSSPDDGFVRGSAGSEMPLLFIRE